MACTGGIVCSLKEAEDARKAKETRFTLFLNLIFGGRLGEVHAFVLFRTHIQEGIAGWFSVLRCCFRTRVHFVRRNTEYVPVFSGCLLGLHTGTLGSLGRPCISLGSSCVQRVSAPCVDALDVCARENITFSCTPPLNSGQLLCKLQFVSNNSSVFKIVHNCHGLLVGKE